MSKGLIYLLMVFGELLVASLSFLLLGALEPTNLLWINVVVISSVYLLNFALFFDLFGVVTMRGDSSNIGLGGLIMGSTLYSVVALCLVAAGHVFSLNWGIYLVLQGCDIFLLLLFVVFSFTTSSSAQHSLQSVSDRKSSLQSIVSQLNSIEMKFSSVATMGHRVAQVAKLREELRFITYSDSPLAREIESKLSIVIRDMAHIPNETQQDKSRWMDAVDSCYSLIKLRLQEK